MTLDSIRNSYFVQVKSRTRECNIAQYGGSSSVCTGPETQDSACEAQSELRVKQSSVNSTISFSSGAQNGHWSSWGSWSSCSTSCDTGRRTRTQRCIYPNPSCPGASCPGSASQVSQCENKKCESPTTFDALTILSNIFRLQNGYKPSALMGN